MNNLIIDEKVFNKFGPYTLITGILLIGLGTAGIILPGVMSLGTAVSVAWLLLIGGGVWASHTYKYSPKNVMDWLKPGVLLIIGGLMLFYPVSGVEAVGLLLAVYLLLHAFGSFALAQTIHPCQRLGLDGFQWCCLGFASCVFPDRLARYLPVVGGSLCGH